MRHESDTKFYIHSKCCMAHWELVYTQRHEYRLLCEECGKDSGCAIVKRKGE